MCIATHMQSVHPGVPTTERTAVDAGVMNGACCCGLNTVRDCQHVAARSRRHWVLVDGCQCPGSSKGRVVSRNAWPCPVFDPTHASSIVDIRKVMEMGKTRASKGISSVADRKKSFVIHTKRVSYCMSLPLCIPHLPKSLQHRKQSLHPSLERRGSVVVIGEVCAGILEQWVTLKMCCKYVSQCRIQVIGGLSFTFFLCYGAPAPHNGRR